MSEFVVRSVVSPVEVVGDGRTVVGLVAPFGQIATVDDGFGPYRETLDPGCFDRVMRARPQHVRVHLEHAGQWVGRGDRWMSSDKGLTMALRLDDSEFGRAAAFKVRDGQTPGLSIGFVPGKTITKMHDDGPVEHRVTIKSINHVALVPMGAYAEAQVSSVRAASADRIALWQEWLQAQ